MSDTESTPTQPRRSQRERKQTERLGDEHSPLKRKRAESDDEDVHDHEEDVNTGDEGLDVDQDNNDAEDEEEEEGYAAPKRKHKATPKHQAKTTPPRPKKARTAGNAAAGDAPAKKPRARKARGAIDLAQVSKDTNIENDNSLFNAILNPATALQTTVEDFLESFSETPAAALADLINCVLRSCGCNDSVDSDQVVDFDAIVDALDTFTEQLRKENSPTYPLNSKLSVFKPFRKSLSEFLTRLVQSAADAGVLCPPSSGDEADLIPTLQAWVIAMSSSVIRSFRHTATVIALETQTALCTVAAAIDSELEMVQRQREGEKKKKSKGKGATSGRDKEFELKAQEIKEKRSKVSEFIKEFFDGVFVHRYRDFDPSIRADCVQALGKWLLTHSSYFLDSSYLRYIGWVLSDSVSSVRLSAVKSLTTLYAKKDFAVSLSNFTDRFKTRLIEMASRDMDLTIRVATIGLLSNMEEQLEDDQKERVCLMIFDEELRVRKAVSGFVKGVWDEAVEERMVGHTRDDKTVERVGVKCLAELLVKWSKALDSEQGEDNEEGSQSQADSHQSEKQAKEVRWLINTEKIDEGRVAIVVEALSEDIDAISAWEPLLENLLLDHSAGTAENATAGKKKGRGGRAVATANTEDVVEDVWRLDEVEEGVMLEVLAAALARAKAAAAMAAGAHKKGKDKETDDSVVSEITRALIKSLPRLIHKHQTDEGRIAEVLLIPQVMNLDMYLEMRMVTGYEALWDDVMKQFLTHSAPRTVAHAVATMMHMLDATTLSTTNTAKCNELEEELANSLRDAVAGREELEVTTFTEDETRTLASICTRIATLCKSRDMTTWMEEDEGGKQSSIWDIISALFERATLSYEDEEKMMVDCVDILAMHVIWSSGKFAKPETQDSAAKENLLSKREVILDKFTDYAVGPNSRASEEIKRATYQYVLSLYSLSCSLPTLELTMSDEMQYRFAGFVQSEIERYAADLNDFRAAQEQPLGSEASDEELETQASRKKKKSGKSGTQTQTQTQGMAPLVRNSSKEALAYRQQLEREYVMNSITSAFLRAIRVHVIGVRHCGILLAHYGRLDSTFDTCVKIVVDVLREEGILNSKSEVVVSVALQALRESFSLYLDGLEEDDSHTLALAKLLGSCFVIRGAQLAIVRRVETSYLARLHTVSLSWIVKKIAEYHSAGEIESKNKALTFFRVLMPLVIHMENRDMLQIKAHLDQAFATAKIEPTTTKVWDAYRAYEKRLTPGGSKGKGGRKGKSKKAINGEIASEDEHEVVGLLSESEKEENQQLPPSQRPRPRPKRRAYNLRSSDDEVEVAPHAEEEMTQTTPRPKRVTATYSRTPKRNGIDTPALNGDVDEDAESEAADKDEVMHVDEDVATQETEQPAAEEEPVANFKSKRKRIAL